jgi:hypothetical protein
MKITKKIAQKYIKDNDSVDLFKFTILEDAEAAEILAQSEGNLFLVGLETLSDDAALALSERKGGINLSLKLGDTPGHLALKKSLPVWDESDDEPDFD